MNDIAKEIAKKSKSSFYYAFNLLPAEKRDAMNTVYAFCRETDDIVDEGSVDDNLKFEKLRKWRIELEKSLNGHSDYQLINKLSRTIQKFKIPLEPFFDLLKGMEMDLRQKRYLTFNDLQNYCYNVASTVGLMCIEIFGYRHPSAKDFAVNLGIALQLTNILRDVKKDAERGRIYLPNEDLLKFNYHESDILNCNYNDDFQRMMKFQVERARGYFNVATSYLDREDKKTMFAARAMQHIYYRMLNKIAEADYDVYNKEIKISTVKKVGISLGVWAKYSLVY
ncbi:MAG: presqualene diphosphate synthase HpnD [Ignavibacteriota bacterium]|jgi:phytoene synthase|nr:presqualene diphosphate synthase HpnD [Ignavibacteriales bacterium]MBL1124260.1 squalene synthase HpnD [Ignavibacteriota bacterium]MCC7095187.1 presqualene diphosphate synthase HpnD [Ignavibacteriaceae bacterium]MCE7855383.1 squalene synthase HpnD [Ignavibacteria bacterium CHB3]MEB2296274.1 presqualene diphosphate synthase HpnD [Ignavibacteria bacterium]